MPGSHYKHLKTNDEKNNTNEHCVCMHSIQEVDFIINLSCAKHVKDLHPYEHVENDGQVS